MSVSTKKNLVIDMDETLLHCITDKVSVEDLHAMSALEALQDRLYVIQPRDIFEADGADVETPMIAVERPYLQTFLQYIHANFDTIIIWSAGQEAYVHENIAFITRWCKGAVNAVFHYDDCAIRSDGVLTKPLAKLMEEFPELHLSNTFIIDDRATAFISENPNNGILIPAYHPSPRELVDMLSPGGPGDQDQALLELIRFFEQPHVAKSKDVTTIPKGIFGISNIPRAMGRATVHPSKGDGDCLFSAVCAAIGFNPVLQIHAEERLRTRRQLDDLYATSVRKWPFEPLLSPKCLRALVLVGFQTSPERAHTYLAAHNELRAVDPTHPEVRWLEPAFVSTEHDGRKGYNHAKFMALIMDKTKYWGDGAAIDLLGQALGISIRCWKWNNEMRKLDIVYPCNVRNAIGWIDLLRTGEHFEALTFDFNPDAPT